MLSLDDVERTFADRSKITAIFVEIGVDAFIAEFVVAIDRSTDGLGIQTGFLGNFFNGAADKGNFSHSSLAGKKIAEARHLIAGKGMTKVAEHCAGTGLQIALFVIIDERVKIISVDAQSIAAH